MEIKKYGQECLKKKALPVKEINAEIRKLVQDMIETMHEAKGVGLAANQVGILLRIIVVDTSEVDPRTNLMALINPEILKAEGLEEMEEGCLSLPGVCIKIKRPKKITVKSLNIKGEPILTEVNGLCARAIQHEIDHLNGRVLLDYISVWQKWRLQKSLRKVMAG